MSDFIKIDFDFTQDTDSYWKNWWTKEKGDDLIGTKHVSDPDGQSKTLNDYHKFLWSKKLPDGRIKNGVLKINNVHFFSKSSLLKKMNYITLGLGRGSR